MSFTVYSPDTSYRIEFCSKLAVQLAAAELAQKNYRDLAKLMDTAFNGGARTLAGNIFEQMFLNYIRSSSKLKKGLEFKSLPATEDQASVVPFTFEHNIHFDL